MKKEYMKPSMEAIEIKCSQILCGSGPGSGIHGDSPQPPGGAMAPGLFEGEEWDVLLGD